MEYGAMTQKGRLRAGPPLIYSIITRGDIQAGVYVREFGPATPNFPDTGTAPGLDAWKQLDDIQELSHLLFLRLKKRIGRILAVWL